jgi:hypothetical protein
MSVALPLRCRDEIARSRRVRPIAEGLEDRMLLYATLGAQWTYGSRVTFSFAPDGTSIGGVPSAWFQVMSSRGIATTTWQQQFQKAVALWETVAGVNLVQVGDDGSSYSCPGNQQGDSRFGDIRIGGIAMSPGTLAVTFAPPPINGGTAAGDIVMNTTSAWNVNNDYDIESVALHEFGHTLGLDHSTVYQAVMYAYYTGVKQTLSSDDSAGLAAVYGARPGDAFEPNNTYTAATDITSKIDSKAQISIPNLDISSATDNDWFSVVVPRTTTGTMVVKMQATGLSSLAPKMAVYDSGLRTLASAGVVSAYGDTATMTITGVAANQTYYIRALDANGGAGSVGAYGLQINFGSQPQSPIPPPNTVVAEQPDRGGGLMSMSVPGGVFDARTGVLTRGGASISDPVAVLAQLGGGIKGQPTRIKIGTLALWGDALMADRWSPPPPIPAVPAAPPGFSAVLVLPPTTNGAAMAAGPTDAGAQPNRPRGRSDLTALDAALDAWDQRAADS